VYIIPMCIVHNVGWTRSTYLRHFLNWQNLSVMMKRRAFFSSFLRITVIRLEQDMVD